MLNNRHLLIVTNHFPPRSDARLEHVVLRPLLTAAAVPILGNKKAVCISEAFLSLDNESLDGTGGVVDRVKGKGAFAVSNL